MGMDIRRCIHVGVSFVEAFEKDDGVIDKINEVAEELNLDSELEMREADEISDVFIGVSFANTSRPTDAQVKRAKKKVNGLLAKIEKLVGHKASSKVVEWNVTTVTY